MHTGAQATIEIQPAPEDHGIVFLTDGARIPATAENVLDTSRATVLGIGSRSVSTVEHLLSAFAGMGITNAEIVVAGPEIPIVDGSAKAFADAFASVGTDVLPAPRPQLDLVQPYEMCDGDRALILLPGRRLRIRFVADYPAPIGVQYFDACIDSEYYRAEIAPARTFGFLHEVETLRARGLARGGTLENAVIFAPTGAMQELRWPDEVVRHKVLDLIGDLALLGMDLSCDVIAMKTGHDLHARAMLELRRKYGASPFCRPSSEAS